MSQGLIVAILSILFYLSNLLGGNVQHYQPSTLPAQEESFFYLGQSGQILGDKVLVRENYASDSNPLGTLHRYDEVIILDKRNDWYKVLGPAKLEGWIPDFHLELTAHLKTDAAQELNKIVLGYLSQDDLSYESLLENNSLLTGVVPFGWQMDSYGALNSDFAGEALGKSLYFAGNRQLETYALIEINSEPLKLFNNAYLQEQAASAIFQTVQEWGLKGVQLDLNYNPTQVEGLEMFLQKLNEKLDQKGIKTIVALPLNEAIDYRAISDSVHHLVLKPNVDLEKPGPVAPMSELKEGLQMVLNQVSKEKIILGISTAGYNWPRMGLPTSISYQEIMELAAHWGASVKWDAKSMTPHFQYGTGHEIWFENRYSLKYKLDLVKEYDLGGLAFIELGQEDPEIWKTLKKLF